MTYDYSRRARYKGTKQAAAGRMNDEERFTSALRTLLEPYNFPDDQNAAGVFATWAKAHRADKLRSAISYLAAAFTMGLYDLVREWVRLGKPAAAEPANL